VVAEVNGKEYPELKESLKFTKKIAAAEEDSFRTTIDRGLNKLEEMIDEIKDAGKTTLPGDKAFALYDTYGFPSDLTKEILMERGFDGFDESAFDQCMEEQRARAQAAWKGSGETKVDVGGDLPATEFTGYDSTQEKSQILGIFSNSQPLDAAVAGQPVEIVVEKSPFYAEAGGQVGDKGRIESDDALVRVETTRKSAAGIYVHFGEVEYGTICKGDSVQLAVDPAFREPTKKNHTATHLLHTALRSVLGSHVKQSGSLVDPEALRFDFTHYEAVKPADLRQIEKMVNAWVYENHPVRIKTMSMDEAQNEGAIALFGEKYSEEVRTVKIVDEHTPDGHVSMELCGGTHVNATGEIGAFRILDESSISAGNRRIEATTGPHAVEYTQEEHGLLGKIAGELKVAPRDVPERIQRILDQAKQLEKENRELKQKLLRGETTNLLEGAEEINGLTVLARQMDGADKDELQAAMDSILKGAKKRAALLAAPADGKVTLICGVSDDLTQTLDAGKMVKEIAAIVGGGGGGRKDRAQAGGKDVTKIPDAIKRFKERIQEST
ncbi:alanine--tRNA ligase, partial [bacterium]|nr:alanine--tRNA ligase [bacterium]